MRLRLDLEGLFGEACQIKHHVPHLSIRVQRAILAQILANQVQVPLDALMFFRHVITHLKQRLRQGPAKSTTCPRPKQAIAAYPEEANDTCFFMKLPVRYTLNSYYL